MMGTILRSYSQMHDVEAKDVFVPNTLEELRTKLMELNAEGRRVTFRAEKYSHSFDAQALNDDVVILMEKLNDIGEPSREKLEITVGPGARWGDIVEKTLEEDLVCPVVVTTPAATAAGTLSANCLTRGTYRYGSLGMNTKRLTLLIPSGESLELAPDDKPIVIMVGGEEKSMPRSELFNAVVQGYGYLGVITSITFKLISVAIASKEEIAPGEVGLKLSRAVERAHVVTSVTRFERFEALIGLFEGLLRRLGSDSTKSDPDLPNDVYSIVFRDANNNHKGFFFETSYDTEGEKRRPKPEGGLIFYRHQHEFAEVLKKIFKIELDVGTVDNTVNRLLAAVYGNRLVSFMVKDAPTLHRDQYDDYTFMTELLDVVREIRYENQEKPPIIQQTYVLPRSQNGSHEDALAFLNELDQLFEENPAFRPSFFDIGYIGGGDKALLSATRGKPSFGISVALDAGINDKTRKQEIIKLLEEISVLCDKHHGTVHLIKNVYCPPNLLDKMYKSNLVKFCEIKRMVDPKFTLRNSFFDKLFGAGSCKP